MQLGRVQRANPRLFWQGEGYERAAGGAAGLAAAGRDDDVLPAAGQIRAGRGVAAEREGVLPQDLARVFVEGAKCLGDESVTQLQAR